jgi:hypothetical protein
MSQAHDENALYRFEVMIVALVDTPLRAVLHSTYDETQTGGQDGEQPKVIYEAADSAAFFVP